MIARATTFESGAERYDLLRPGYPEQLFDDVMGYTSGRLDIAVLDVGAGTGKATIPWPRAGCPSRPSSPRTRWRRCFDRVPTRQVSAIA